MLTCCHVIPSQTMPKTQQGWTKVDIVEIFGLHVVDLASEFFAEVAEGYTKCRDLNMICKILSNPNNAENHTLNLIPGDRIIKNSSMRDGLSWKMTYCTIDSRGVTG